MYELNYESAKMMFAKTGRIDDALLGSFEVIRKVNLDDEVDSEKKPFAFEAYYFYSENDDPIKKMYMINICKKISNKYCQLTTSAPAKEWLKNDFEAVDKIVIKRYDVDDIKNAEKLRENTLNLADYKKMDSVLKAKCAFEVDCEKAGITTLEELKKMIAFAHKAEIPEIIFVAEKQLKRIESDYGVEAEVKRRIECIRRIRNGQKLKQGMLQPLKIDNNVNLFITMRNFLIQAGWHFSINKAISEKNKFFVKTTLTNGEMDVVFKQRIEDNTLKLEMWRHSKSHKYIVE